MARTVTEIYNDMIAEKETMATLSGLQPDPDSFQTFLDDLTTTSKVAIWRLMFYVVAVAIFIHESLWDIKLVELEDAALRAIPGTERWWYEQCLLFQYGDALSWVDGKYQYVPVDTTAQIIISAAALGVGGALQLKVAKDDGSGFPTALSAAEVSSFEAYVDQIKPAGTITTVISETADLLHIVYDVYYNPLLLNPDGSLISDAGVFPVEDAITNHISNLQFNGYLYLSELEDAIQGAIGVNDFERNTAEAKYGALAYAAIDVKYNANAGYMAIDPIYPLSTTITYIAS